jgi:hypothetical protein
VKPGFKFRKKRPEELQAAFDHNCSPEESSLLSDSMDSSCLYLGLI